MYKHLILMLGLLGSISTTVWAAPAGEYWEITSKMVMEGMPMAMPAQTIKVCAPKGESLDPREANKGHECQFSNYKASGQKVSYSFRCVEKGTVMTGDAEYTLGVNKYDGVMHMNTKGDGQNMKMTQHTSGKLVGGSCDPGKLARDNEERMRAATASRDKECNTSGYTTEMWIDNSWKFTHNNQSCPPGNQQKEMCAAINKDVGRNAKVYTKMVKNDDLIGICKVDINAATKSICKTVNKSNVQQLAAYCPAEAKALREAKRKQKCQGRDFTGSNNGCGDDDGGRDYTATQPDSKKPGDNASGNNGAVNGVLEGANKLRRVFGF